MSIEDCAEEVGRAGKMTPGEARKLLDDVDERAGQLQHTLGLTEPESMVRAANEMAARAKLIAAVEQRNQLMNLQKRLARRARIEATAEAIGGKYGVDLVRAVRNTMVAINTPVRGGRMSAEAEGMTWHDRYVSGVTRELDRAGLYQAARSNAFQNQWGRELFELSRQDAGRRANPGVTGNAEALGIAKILHKYLGWAKLNLNKEGAWIGDYTGYISRTMHDGDKMRRAGRDAWIKAVVPLLDHDRMFGGFQRRPDMLARVYNDLVTGVHLSDEDGLASEAPGVTGRANLADKMSQSRVLHFKDAESWLSYQQQFGQGTLLEQVYGTLGRAAHSQALLSRWGTNPGAEFDQDMRYISTKYRQSNTEAVDRLGQARTSLRAIFDTLTGEANRPANRDWARRASYTRLVESMAKLGMVMFTHLSAMVNKAGELHYQGVPWAEAYGNFFASPFRSLEHGEAAAWADETLAGMEGTNREIISEFSPNDTLPGTAARLSNVYFRLNGLTWLLNKQKAGAEWALSRRAGLNFGNAYGDLPSPMQRILNAYDISPAEWDLLRQAPDHSQIDGRAFLTPQAAIRAPSEAIEAMMRANGDLDFGENEATTARRVDAVRQTLAMKVHAWLHDTADRSVVTPGAEDRALFTFGKQPGTWGGEFGRFIAQFKMWPAAAIRQQWGRDLYGTPGDTMGKVGGVMNLLVGSMITGYAVMTLKDLLKGQHPRSPVDPRTMAAALMQGGGMGIAGDFLFGEYSRFGQNVAESALGPVLGQGIANVMDLFNRIKARAEGTESANMRDHPASDIGPDLTKMVVDNMPFVNLFYTRQALNYLFLYSLQETMRPGYLQRSERTLKARTGTTMWMSPAENHLHTFGR